MKKILLALCLMLLMIMPVSEAAIETIEADGTHIMGDTDSRDMAQKLAIDEAINNAALQAGTYIASYTTVKNYVITEDEIKSITSSIVKVLDQKITFDTPSADKWVCHAHIIAEVDTSYLERLVDAYIEKQKNANNHAYIDPVPANNNVYANGNIGDAYSYSEYDNSDTPMPFFPQYQPDTITQTLRGDRKMYIEAPPPLAAIPIERLQRIYTNSNAFIEEAADNDANAYNIYRITNNAQQDYTYAIYDKTGQKLMCLYTICWNNLMERRLQDLQEIIYMNGMNPTASSRQFNKKLYRGYPVDVKTDYLSFQSHNGDYKIVMKIENWQSEGFSSIQIRRSNSMYY